MQSSWNAPRTLPPETLTLYPTDTIVGTGAESGESAEGVGRGGGGGRGEGGGGRWGGDSERKKRGKKRAFFKALLTRPPLPWGMNPLNAGRS
jgi:hypothetical protein